MDDSLNVIEIESCQIVKRVPNLSLNQIFLDELCIYLGIMDDREKGIDFYLFNWGYHIKKAQKTIVKTEVIEDNGDDETDLMKNRNKTSCCVIF